MTLLRSLHAETGFWQFHATFTQADAAAKDVVVDVAIGNGMAFIMDMVTIGPDNYGGARTSRVQIEDAEATPNVIAQLFSGTLDNQTLRLPALGVVLAADAVTGLDRPFIIGGTDKFSTQIDALILNEVITLQFRARLLFGVKPTISVAQSEDAPDVTIATTYSRIM